MRYAFLFVSCFFGPAFEVFTTKQTLSTAELVALLQKEPLSSCLKSQLKPSLLPNDFYVRNRVVERYDQQWDGAYQCQPYCLHFSFRYQCVYI